MNAKFHVGQEVEVDHVGWWRKAKVIHAITRTNSTGEATSLYFIEYADGDTAVVDADHIRRINEGVTNF